MKILQILKHTFLSPILSLRREYIPLLAIYFAYGMQGLTAVALTFWEKETLSLSTEQFIIISTWLTLPWTLKMIFGQLVDTVPIFGSRRKVYVYLGATLMALGYLVLAGMMVKSSLVTWMGSEFTMYLASSLLTVFGFVIQDVTADTMSTEVVDRTDLTDEQIRHQLTMVQILGRLSLMIGAVVAAALAGPLAAKFRDTPQVVALIALILPLLSILGASFVRLKSDQNTVGKSYPIILFGGLFYAAFMLFMAFSGSISWIVTNASWLTTWSQEIVFFVSLSLLLPMLWVLLRSQPRQRVMAIIFVFTALFVFRAVPGVGPGFSWWAIDVLGFDPEFLGLIQFVGALIPLIVLWLFSSVIAQASVRWVLMGLVLAGTLFSLPELGLFYGIHETLGLSPRLVVLSDTVFDSPLVHISMIPMLALIAYFAPAHSRATWFAVMASLMNLAQTAKQLGTKYLNQAFVVTREVKNDVGEILTPMNYTLLGDLLTTKIVIGLVVPMLVLLLVWNRIRI